jgi:hypothetical protein
MRFHRKVVLALVVCAAIGASSPSAHAQYRVNNRYAQNTAPTNAAPAMVPTTAAPSTAPAMRGNTEELPLGQSAPGQYSGPTESSGYGDGSMSPYYSGESCGPLCGCPQACSDPCCSCECDQSCGFESNSFCGLRGGSWFVTADLLAVRAHFSDALAFATQIDTNTTPSTTVQHFHQIDYDPESSFRVGGGYRLCNCGEEIVFNFTRFRSSGDASVTAPPQGSGTTIIFPFDVNPLNGNNGQTGTVHSSVDMNSGDLEWRKTIPLGGCCCSSCGDACGCGNSGGCGDCCRPSCPAWDITWSGGIRVAQGGWDRDYFVDDPQDATLNIDTRVDIDFEGVGPRFGLEGRRYFGCDGWFSTFLKGNVSLLFSRIETETRQETFITGAENITTEVQKVQEVVPVIDMEAGISAQVTCRSTFSAGYLLSAWHDLGFRGEPVRANIALNTSYDDANILSFDGFFVRYEWTY